MFKEITDRLKNSVFCYNNADGEGFVDKEKCQCFDSDGKLECNAKIDRARFISRYKSLESEGYGHNEIHRVLKTEFIDSEWYHANVKR